jgi:flagellar hook-length control protein FliK
VASTAALASALNTDTLPAQRTAPIADHADAVLPARPGVRPRVAVASGDAALPKSADAAAQQQLLPIEDRSNGSAAIESEFLRTAAALDVRGAPAARSEPIPGTPLSLSAALSAGAALGTSATPATFTLGHAQVGTPVGAHGFNDDFSQRVLMLAGQRVQSAEIALTPADLGPITVSMELRGQEASLVFGAAQSATRLAIEDALPRLREMFQTHGLHLVDAHVGAQVGHQNRREGGAGSPHDTRSAPDARSAPIGEAGASAASATVLSRTNRLIDVRV